MSSETPAGTDQTGHGVEHDDVRRGRRRRTLTLLALISVGWKVLLFTVGAAGLDELPAPQRPYGTAAIATAGAAFDLPLERFTRVVRRVRVVSVDDGGVRDSAAPSAIRAPLRAYTYFGTPTPRCARGAHGGWSSTGSSGARPMPVDDAR